MEGRERRRRGGKRSKGRKVAIATERERVELHSVVSKPMMTSICVNFYLNYSPEVEGLQRLQGRS